MHGGGGELHRHHIGALMRVGGFRLGNNGVLRLGFRLRNNGLLRLGFRLLGAQFWAYMLWPLKVLGLIPWLI